MNRLILCVLASMAFPALCFADVTNLPAADLKVLRDTSRFHEVHSATNLPPAIIALCADRNGRFAEPGQNWNPTDVIIDKSVPQSRLIWAVTDGDYYVVHYERGGYDHSFHFLVVRLKAGESKPSFIWRGEGLLRGPLKDYSAFLKELQMRRGRLYDDPPGP